MHRQRNSQRERERGREREGGGGGGRQRTDRPTDGQVPCNSRMAGSLYLEDKGHKPVPLLIVCIQGVNGPRERGNRIDYRALMKSQK